MLRCGAKYSLARSIHLPLPLWLFLRSNKQRHRYPLKKSAPQQLCSPDYRCVDAECRVWQMEEFASCNLCVNIVCTASNCMSFLGPTGHNRSFTYHHARRCYGKSASPCLLALMHPHMGLRDKYLELLLKILTPRAFYYVPTNGSLANTFLTLR